MTEQYQQLNTEEREILLIILGKFKYMFGGALGTWNTTLVDLELNNDGKPVCLQPYPLPRVHQAMFKKESKRLVTLGVLEEENDSEWGSPWSA